MWCVCVWVSVYVVCVCDVGECMWCVCGGVSVYVVCVCVGVCV